MGVHEPVGKASTQSQRDMGTKELHGWTGGHPLELAPSTVSSVLPGQGMCSGDGACCCQSFLPDGGSFGGRAACIFHSGMGVFIAFSHCSNEHSRNTLESVACLLKSIWAAHACAHMYGC